MAPFLVVIGLFGILVTLVQIVRGKLGKHNINKTKQLFLFLGCFVVGLVLTPSTNSNTNKDQNSNTRDTVSIENNANKTTNEEKKVQKQKEEEVETAKLSDNNSIDMTENTFKVENELDNNKSESSSNIDANKSEDKKVLRAIAVAEIEKNFEELCDIETKDEDSVFFIHMYPKDDLEVAITQLMMDSQNPEIRNSWKFATDGVLKMSNDYHNLVGENVSISIRNPVNTDNLIYTTFNGVEYYNIIDDLN